MRVLCILRTLIWIEFVLDESSKKFKNDAKRGCNQILGSREKIQYSCKKSERYQKGRLAKSYIKTILTNSIQKKFINKENFIINIFKNILSKLKRIKLSIKNRIFMKSDYFIRFKYYLDLIRYS